MSIVTLAENNSIVIPPEIFKKLGLVPGDSLTLEEVNGELVLRPIRAAVETPITPVVTAGTILNDAIARKNLGIGIRLIYDDQFTNIGLNGCAASSPIGGRGNSSIWGGRIRFAGLLTRRCSGLLLRLRGCWCLSGFLVDGLLFLFLLWLGWRRRWRLSWFCCFRAH